MTDINSKKNEKCFGVPHSVAKEEMYYRNESIQHALNVVNQTGLFKSTLTYATSPSEDFQSDLDDLFQIANNFYNYINKKGESI